MPRSSIIVLACALALAAPAAARADDDGGGWSGDDVGYVVEADPPAPDPPSVDVSAPDPPAVETSVAPDPAPEPAAQVDPTPSPPAQPDPPADPPAPPADPPAPPASPPGGGGPPPLQLPFSLPFLSGVTGVCGGASANWGDGGPGSWNAVSGCVVVSPSGQVGATITTTVPSQSGALGGGISVGVGVLTSNAPNVPDLGGRFTQYGCGGDVLLGVDADTFNGITSDGRLIVGTTFGVSTGLAADCHGGTTYTWVSP